MVPVCALGEALKALDGGPAVFEIGDSREPRTAFDAMQEAAALGHRCRAAWATRVSRPRCALSRLVLPGKGTGAEPGSTPAVAALTFDGDYSATTTVRPVS